MRERIAYQLYRFLWVVADWVFPPECAGCGKPGFRFCPECWKQIELLDHSICPKCGAPSDSDRICNSCVKSQPPYEMLRSYALFQDPLRKAIHHLKYKQDLALAVTLAEPLMDWMYNQLKWQFDMILTVPLNQERLKTRGFNQSNLISFPISLALHVPFLPNSVRRFKNTLSQVGLSALQRKENVKDAFIADESIVKGKTILLIDDVVTTGATIVSCSEALIKAGALKVYCLSVAKTPLKLKIHDKINEFAT